MAVERIDFGAASESWRIITTTTNKGTVTEQWQLTIRYRVPTGEIGKRGKPVTVEKRRTKLFPATTDLSTKRKKDSAARRFKSELTKENERAIEEEERLLARESEEQAAESLPSNMLVGKYVSRYLDSIEHSVERVTIGNYRTICTRISEGFSDTKLSELTTDAIQHWEKGLIDSGLAPATVIKYHRVLSEACKSAVNSGHLVTNPCAGVKMPKRVPPSPNSLTVDGFIRLTKTLSTLEASPLTTAAFIALHTGMREGEVCGLKWKCYGTDEDGNLVINVVESIGKAKGGTYSKAPKTKASRRRVPVTNELAEMLGRRRNLMLAELAEGDFDLSEEDFGNLYIVGNIEGRYMSPTSLSRAWKEFSASFGLRGTQGRAVTFHDLRHSAATVMIALGADVKAVASILGHENSQITLNTYADADPQSKLHAVRRLPSSEDAKPLARIEQKG